jgi:hypothetical protein
MATFAITMRSIYYEYYEVEADTEEQAKALYNSHEWGVQTLLDEWREDTELYNIDDVTDIYEGEKQC